uniref:Uncharacterized protein n=1 Tax=Anguilla anguilla TaxID=7936 RepID=A0A0E9PTP2_ANGAN
MMSHQSKVLFYVQHIYSYNPVTYVVNVIVIIFQTNSHP